MKERMEISNKIKHVIFEYSTCTQWIFNWGNLKAEGKYLRTMILTIGCGKVEKGNRVISMHTRKKVPRKQSGQYEVS